MPSLDDFINNPDLIVRDDDGKTFHDTYPKTRIMEVDKVGYPLSPSHAMYKQGMRYYTRLVSVDEELPDGESPVYLWWYYKSKPVDKIGERYEVGWKRA